MRMMDARSLSGWANQLQVLNDGLKLSVRLHLLSLLFEVSLCSLVASWCVATDEQIVNNCPPRFSTFSLEPGRGGGQRSFDELWRAWLTSDELIFSTCLALGVRCSFSDVQEMRMACAEVVEESQVIAVLVRLLDTARQCLVAGDVRTPK